jgi:serine/threonine protein kinase/predicted ATPase
MIASFAGYRVRRVLGRGGMGVVYLAEDDTTGELLALKTLRGSRAQALRGIRREIDALKRLNHPGVVKMISAGVEDDMPWYTMEFLEGKTLQEHLTVRQSRRTDGSDEGAATVTAELTSVQVENAESPSSEGVRGRNLGNEYDYETQELLRWAGQILQVLAYVHGEGIVHADVKPSNILITESGNAVLVDFGIVFGGGDRTDAQDLAQVGMRQGTVKYMSPERLRGQLFDGRADLYAMGCILYEILVGHPPFRSGGKRGIIRSHLEEVPSRVADLAPVHAAALSDVVAALLAKEPRNRPGYAQAVLGVLMSGGVVCEAYSGAPNPKPHLFLPSMVGREPVFQLLCERMDRAKAGHGGVVLLGGEEGVGKTRLAAEVVRRARSRGALVLSGSSSFKRSDGRVGGSGPPLHIFAPVFRQIADASLEGADVGVEDLTLRRAKVLAPYAPFLAKLALAECSDPPSQLPPEEARLRVFHTLWEYIGSFTNERETVLVLDDLECADGLSVAALRFLLRRGFGGRSWLVLGLYTAEYVGDWLAEFQEIPGVPSVRLDPLSEQDVHGVVEEMMGLADVPRALMPFVLEYSQGNPLFVSTCIRSAVDNGFLGLDEDGRWLWSRGRTAEMLVAPAPIRLQTMVNLRLETLNSALQEVCRTLAIFGLEAEVDLVRQVGKFEEGFLFEALDVMEERGVVQSVNPNRVRFLHPVFRETVEKTMASDELIRRHGLVAEELSRMAVEGREVDRAQIAWHWERANEKARARDAYWHAGKEAARRYAYLDARKSYERGFSLCGRRSRRIVLRELEFVQEVLVPQRLHEEISRWCEKIIEGTAAAAWPRQRLEGLRLRGASALSLGRYREARTDLHRAVEGFRAERDQDGTCLTLRALAGLEMREGQMEEAEHCLQQARIAAKATGNALAEAGVLADLALHAYQCRDFSASLGFLERALPYFREGDEVHETVRSLMHQGLAHDALGQWNLAVACHSEALELCSATGNRRYEAKILGNLSIVWSKRGETNQALDAQRRALEIFAEAGDRKSVGVVLVNMGATWSTSGDFVEASSCYQQALEVHRVFGDRRREANTLGKMAVLSLRCGELDDAARLFDRSMEIYKTVDKPEGLATVQVARARMLRLVREGDEAGTALAEAMSWCEHSGREHWELLVRFEMAHLALVDGESVTDTLDAADRFMERTGLVSGSELGLALKRLRRAAECDESERFRGESAEELGEQLIRSLRAYRSE